MKREIHSGSHAKLFYYRTNSGIEIDLIIDRKSFKELIEIKSTETFKTQMLTNIESLLEKNDRGYLLYNGKTIPYNKQLQIKNYQDY